MCFYGFCILNNKQGLLFKIAYFCLQFGAFLIVNYHD